MYTQDLINHRGSNEDGDDQNETALNSEMTDNSNLDDEINIRKDPLQSFLGGFLTATYMENTIQFWTIIRTSSDNGKKLLSPIDLRLLSAFASECHQKEVNQN